MEFVQNVRGLNKLLKGVTMGQVLSACCFGDQPDPVPVRHWQSQPPSAPVMWPQPRQVPVGHSWPQSQPPPVPVGRSWPQSQPSPVPVGQPLPRGPRC